MDTTIYTFDELNSLRFIVIEKLEKTVNVMGYYAFLELLSQYDDLSSVLENKDIDVFVANDLDVLNFIRIYNSVNLLVDELYEATYGSEKKKNGTKRRKSSKSS